MPSYHAILTADLTFINIDELCADDGCNRQHVHVFTNDEQRARDGRIIRAAYQRAATQHPGYLIAWPSVESYDAIIASV